MKKIWLLLSLFFLICVTAQAYAGEHRLGGGVNYWIAVEDVDFDDIDEDGLSFVGSYQYWPTLIGLEFDLEMLPDKYGETAFAPQAFVLVGRSIYAGIGAGIEFRDSEFAEEPFFTVRAGLNLELLPAIWWDIYGSYRFNDTAELDNLRDHIDTDTVFLGTTVRIEL